MNTQNVKTNKKPAQNNGRKLNMELSMMLTNALGMGPGSQWAKKCAKGRR